MHGRSQDMPGLGGSCESRDRFKTSAQLELPACSRISTRYLDLRVTRRQAQRLTQPRGSKMCVKSRRSIRQEFLWPAIHREPPRPKASEMSLDVERLRSHGLTGGIRRDLVDASFCLFEQFLASSLQRFTALVDRHRLLERHLAF